MTAAEKAMTRSPQAEDTPAPPPDAPSGSFNQRLQALLPNLVLSPSVFLVFVYGFIAFTGYLSFTGRRILPNFDLVGLDNYVRLFSLRNCGICAQESGNLGRSARERRPAGSCGPMAGAVKG